jgi:predicted nucleic acid-binding protein
MQLVVADAGPIHYLVLIEHIDILPTLFERILIPSVVQSELTDAETPPVVSRWISKPPTWLEVRVVTSSPFDDDSLQSLDEGERVAITLAASLEADLLLMDDQAGVAIARRKGFAVTGTLGILDLAARKGILNLADAFERLKRTNFWYPQDVMDALLEKHKKQ